MFKPIKNGASELIQGLNCHIPEPGYLWDYINEQWIFDGVHKPTDFFNDQCWQRDPRWKSLKKWKEAEDKRKEVDPKFEHAELQEFINDCWRWRLSGYWFYNENIPTYITGVHWYYLSCYWMKKIYPDYRDFDRQFFYAWEYADEDPASLGVIYVTKRRLGKSYIAGCIGNEKATRKPQFRAGLQSKTDKDAKKLFDRAIVAPFKRLPYFFQPETNIKSGQPPATTLKFEKGKMTASLDEELGSSIDFQASSELAYDGEELGYYISDEFGKTLSANVADRWDVVRYCLIDNTQAIVGKALHITTVEEMEGGGEAALSLWKDSDPAIRDENGQTASGLYKFFVPAHYGGKTNKYGYCDVEAEREKILASRAIQTDPRKLAAMKRKMPLDEREAFSSDVNNCAFSDPIALDDQLSDLKYLLKPLFRTVNLQWKDGVQDHPDGVVIVDAPNGKFKIAWEPQELHRNLRRMRGGEWFPDNTDMACGGCDPYDHAQLTIEGQRTMSKGAICLVKNQNVLAPSPIDEGPCLLYMNRAAAPEIFYEDCLMAAVYYGCLMLIEDNKPGCIKHFQDRGYGGYLAWLDGRTKPGITNTAPSSGAGINGQIAALTDSYITHHISSTVFPELVEQWLDFDVTKTTKFDGAMAFGFAKILQKKEGSGRKKNHDARPQNIKEVFPDFMVRGGRALF